MTSSAWCPLSPWRAPEANPTWKSRPRQLLTLVTNRGGSWDALPFFARTVHRQSWDPNTQPTAWIGFRCVEDANSQAPTSPLAAENTTGGSDLPIPTTAPPLGGGSEENTANSAPTMPPQPQPTAAGTLEPGGG